MDKKKRDRKEWTRKEENGNEWTRREEMERNGQEEKR